MSYKLLIINPGSTSTKIGVYEDEKELFEETLRHSTEEIAKYDSIYAQRGFRKEVILNVLKEKNFDIKTLHAVVGRGGMLKPIPGGTYAVTEELFHALNQKAVAKRYGKESGKGYENLNLIVVHMGGGVSVGAHNHGRVVDVNNALDGEGAFSPERAGTVPAGDLVKLCFSGKYTEKEVYSKLVGNGGLNAYANTNDMRDVLKMIDEGSEEAKELFSAFIYQVGKDIGAMATVLEGKVDQIVLTGGIAYSPVVTEAIKKRAGWIAGITIYPGEDELLALAQGAIRVLSGEEEAKTY